MFFFFLWLMGFYACFYLDSSVGRWQESIGWREGTSRRDSNSGRYERRCTDHEAKKYLQKITTILQFLNSLTNCINQSKFLLPVNG